MHPYSVMRGAGRGGKSGAMSDGWGPRPPGPWTPTPAPGGSLAWNGCLSPVSCIQDTIQPNQAGAGGMGGGPRGLQGEAGMTDMAAGQTIETAHDREGSRNSQTWRGWGGEARTVLCLGHMFSEFGDAGDHRAQSSQCAPVAVHRAHPNRWGEMGVSAHHLSWEDTLRPRWRKGTKRD